MIEALSLEPPVSEEPFLRRELGLAWTVVDEATLIARLADGPRVVICSEPQPYVQAFAQAPRASVLLVLISDEAYAAERLDLVRRSPAVASVYRHYDLGAAPAGSVRTAVSGFVGDCRGTSQSWRSVWDAVGSGRATRARMAAWRDVEQPVTVIPLGYAAQFERAFVVAHGVADPEQSLWDVDHEPATRAVPISFRGVRGTVQRAVGIERAAALEGADVHIIDGNWSGVAGADAGTAYVEALEGAQLALCPPGFVNGETFRFYEALLCGALPVEVAPALTHLGTMPVRASEAPPSWRGALRDAVGRGERDRQEAVVRARSLVVERLAVIRARITADLEG